MVWFVPVRATVPRVAVKVPPEFVKSPLTDIVVEGAVNVPPEIVKLPFTVILLAVPTHVPPAITKWRFPTVAVWFWVIVPVYPAWMVSPSTVSAWLIVALLSQSGSKITVSPVVGVPAPPPEQFVGFAVLQLFGFEVTPPGVPTQ
jgi:hypothetical protein